MTLIVGNVVDVGLAGLDGALRVWAWFRPEEVGLIAPYRREWEIRQGEIAPGVDVIPGPAVVEVDCGLDAFKTVEVTVPDAPEVAIQDLFEQVYTWSPRVVSEAWEARLGAESAAAGAELSADEAAASAASASTAEEEAALHAATLSNRVEYGTPTVMFTSDGYPYFSDPATVASGDTGWRNMQANLINGWTSYNSYLAPQIRRLGDMVHLYIPALGLDGKDATGPAFLAAPQGFRPAYNYATLGTVYSGTQAYQIRQDMENLLVMYPPKAQVSGTLWWRTTQPWPTTLPGTPAF